MNALIVGAPGSGAGKTTVAAGLMRALARRGLTVQGFKVGPDYIDPTYHLVATGRPSRNLDGWLQPVDGWLDSFHRATAGADVAVVEGVMGLFDGRTGEGDRASTAEVAKRLGAPVALVLDAGKAARSLAATAYGFRHFDSALPFAGVILNRIASDAHLAAVADPVEREARIPLLGHLRRDPDLALPERYLGLVPAPEDPALAETVERAADAVERGVDLDRLLALTRCEPRRPDPAYRSAFPEPGEVTGGGERPVIAVARDRAFSFLYQDNLDLLAAWGADVVPFSPLADAALPAGTAAVYLPGGFPELHAATLAANEPLRRTLLAAHAAGLPIWAECGGLMYLTQGLTDADGRDHRMVGILPGWSRMDRRRLTLGYRTVRARAGTPLTRPGDELPGHEFHWSTLEGGPAPHEAAWDVAGPDSRHEGYAAPNLLASYVHLHLAARRDLAPRFVAAALRARQATETRR